MNIPQVGCSGVEKLSSTVGQLVEFNIALSHLGTVDNCFNQSIQTVSFHKDASKTLLVECSNAGCSSLDPRLKVIRSVGGFDITISLRNLNKSDSGNYFASADIRRPSNSMRVCISKNFSLSVIDTTGKIPRKLRYYGNYQVVLV